MENANAKNLVIAQIESTEAVEALDAITAIPGLDGILLGPNDFTQHIGAFGQYQHPAVVDAITKMAASASKSGKWSGVITGNEDLLRRCCEAGMSFFCSDSELSMLQTGARATLEKINKVTGFRNRT